jgi:flavin reductase (DIM6/NTAB) family NADH-FMN oxidoreductase RutF
VPTEHHNAAVPALEQRALRDALGQFATGVSVITTRGASDEPIALTVNSFTSVSLDPPLILWCIALASSAASLFDVGTPFVVNVLADDQLPQARQFARSGRTELEDAPFTLTATGLPRLKGCVAALECEIVDRYPGGDHDILLSRVIALHEGGAHPLVFFGGQFRRLTTTHLGSEGRPSWFPWSED